MTKEKIFESLNANPVFHLATAEGDQPRVRAMLLYRADENGIIFNTGTMKKVYKQIKNNPKVEMCFYDQKAGLQIRVQGVLEDIDDTSLKDEIVNHPSHSFLKPWVERDGLESFYKTFKVYRLSNGIATPWTIKSTFDTKEPIQL